MTKDEPDMILVSGELRPIAWAVVCPQCGAEIEIECVEEDDAGVFYAAEGAAAPECPTCHVCVETDGVFLTRDESPPYRTR